MSIFQAAARRAPLVTTGMHLAVGPSGSIHLKNEGEQVTGAFKYRGVRTYMLQDTGLGPVVTASTGNHGAAVATMARTLRRTAVIFVPDDTPTAKTDRIAAQGAQIERLAGDYSECARVAAQWAQAHQASYVPSFDHPVIIAGHASLFAESVTQIGDIPATVFVPVGGGGLLTAAVWSFDPATTRIIGVELDGADAMGRSLAAGRRVTIEVPRGVAEGLCVRQVGALPFRVASCAHLDTQTVTVTELEDAVYDLWHTHGLRAELAGAASFAAARRQGLTGPALAVISGSNIDKHVFTRITCTDHAGAA